jgi:hypothetical protein
MFKQTFFSPHAFLLKSSRIYTFLPPTIYRRILLREARVVLLFPRKFSDTFTPTGIKINKINIGKNVAIPILHQIPVV